jgi:hypothetical protein
VAGKDSFFTLTIERSTSPKNIELFQSKTACNSPCTCSVHLILYHRTFFSSHMPNILCRESPFHHTENYMQPVGKVVNQMPIETLPASFEH